MNILIIGSGMYVTGRGGIANGTILSSIAETSKIEQIEKVVVIAKSPGNNTVVTSAAERINHRLGTSLKVEYYSIKGDDSDFISALNKKFNFTCGIVCVPDHLHFQFSKILIENGIHLLVVKPFTRTLEEAEALTELQENAGLWGAVEFHKRFDEANQYAKKTVHQGQIGRPLYITVDYSQKITLPTEIFKSWCAQTNIFQYLGVHYVDLIYYITEYLPTKVTAMGINGTLKERGLDAYDSVHVSIVWKNPDNPNDFFVSMFNTNWIDPKATSAVSDQKYKIIGTKGRIELDQKNRGIEVVNEEEGIRQINPYFSEFVDEFNGFYRFSGYGHESVSTFIKDVSNIVSGKTTTKKLTNLRPSFRSAIVSAAVIDAANQSLQKGFDWVDINIGSKVKGSVSHHISV